MKILGTPQWNALTTAEKNHVNNIHGNDTGDGWTTTLSPGARRVIQVLVAKGLVTADWQVTGNARLARATLRLREAGWRP